MSIDISSRNPDNAQAPRTATGLPRLWSVEELAEATACHPRTIRRAVARGELTCVRLCRRLRFRYRDVQELLGLTQQP